MQSNFIAMPKYYVDKNYFIFEDNLVLRNRPLYLSFTMLGFSDLLLYVTYWNKLPADGQQLF